MPSLSDKLKSLGVKVGAQNIPAPPARITYSIEHVIPGRFLNTPAGGIYVVEEVYPPEFTYGDILLRGSAPLHTLLEWAGYGSRTGEEEQGMGLSLLSPSQFA